MADFHDRLLEGLNPEQREVVLHDQGPLQVVAVAGAGKTHALVNRCGYLVRVRGVDPSCILAVTFSRAGASEMQERLDALIGKSGARIGTFHSLALEILKSESPKYEDWKIDDTDRYRLCIKDTCSYKELNWQDADITLISSFIGLCKANVARPDSEIARALVNEVCGKSKAYASPSRVLQVYMRAEEIRRERLLLTFDDMLMEAVELLRDDEGARARWASRYQYVLQDEAQDMNLAQLLMGELLAKDHRNYMLVGDPAQAIFAFRGAKPERLLAFERDWGAKVILMGRNYRCGEAIIDTANAALDAMDPATRLPVKMIAERREEGGNRVPGVVTCKQYLTLDDEGSGIVDQIQTAIVDGKQPKDFVVLYRVNAQSRAPEEALITARLPYRVIGGISFYERKEVKNLLAYLRLANGTGTLDDVGRCINTPFRFLGKAFVAKVREEAERRGATRGNADWAGIIRAVAEREGLQYRQRNSANLWATLIDEMRARILRGRTATPDTQPYMDSLPAAVLERIVLETRYSEALLKEEGEESVENSRVSNVREMIRAAGRFNSVDDLLSYADKMIAANKDSAKEKNPNKVTLCTLHRSKGLEWPIVFLSGVSEDILPHGRTDDLGEERRLYYVGVTRARDELHASCVRTIAIGSRIRSTEPSRFLGESGLTPVVAESAPKRE